MDISSFYNMSGMTGILGFIKLLSCHLSVMRGLDIV